MEKDALKWEQMALERCGTCVANQMRLMLQGIYKWKDVEEARKLSVKWCTWVPAIPEQTGELREPVVLVGRMVEGYFEGILVQNNYGLTNAFMNGLNRLFSVVKREARGYRTVEYMTTMLYFVTGKLIQLCH